MTNLTTGQKARFTPSNEIVTITKITVHETSYTTAGYNKKEVHVKAGDIASIIVTFDDGEITVASEKDLEVVN